MGKIQKRASPHSDITLSPALKQFIDACVSLPLHQLPSHLGTFPAQWPFPRGDVFNWISVLNRFDEILEKFSHQYSLNEGPQCQPFGRALLLEKPETGDSTEDSTLDRAGFSREGDRELVEHILDFSRVLFENCANRRLYASSQHLDALLNTTSISLLNTALHLALRLAQKYAYDRVRQTGGSRDGLFLTSLSHSTLATHYQINLDKLHKLSLPFRKGLASQSKRDTDIKQTEQGLYVTPTYSLDLLSLLQDRDTPETRKELYGQPYFSLRIDPQDAGSSSNANAESSSTTAGSSTKDNAESSPKGSHFELIEVSTAELLDKPLHEVVKAYMTKFPKQCQYEFLCRLRVAKALCGSSTERAEIVQSRLFAIANYLNIFPEAHHQFHGKIFQIEGDEIQRTKLSSQLCDLLHPPNGNPNAVPRSLQTLALTVLEGYTNHQKKSSELVGALGANVNHGVLTYIVRKFVNDLSESDEDASQEEREWSRALFSLLHSFPKSIPRAGEGLVATGILESFVNALRLHTRRAENTFPQILTFIDVFVYNIRDAFTSLVNAGALDVLSDLLRSEVDQAITTAVHGQGVSDEWKSGVVDYHITFIQQTTLRNLFKLLKNAISSQAGGFDRLMRNLIESAQLLSGLRSVIDFPSLFGSNVWCGAVEIFSTFIHNEPTSYIAIAEAGLTKAFLGTVVSSKESKVSPMSDGSALLDHSTDTQSPPATLEAITTIPLAFSAICLNENGMRQFRESKALATFFQDLGKAAYSKALVDAIEDQRARRIDVESLGGAFDELARHHPQLKPEIIQNFITLFNAVHEDVLNPDHQQAAAYPASGTLRRSTAHVDMLEPLSAPTPAQGSDVEMADSNGKKDHAESGDARVSINLGNMKVVSEIMSGFFANTSFCAPFAEQGGVEKLVDVLAAPLYPLDSPIQISQSGFSRVISTFIIQKPFMMVPLLLDRLQKAAELCAPFSSRQNGTSFLVEFTKKEGERDSSDASDTVCLNAMSTVRNILSVLTPTLLEPSSRTSQQNPMTSINVTDILSTLIPTLVSLSKACMWENALLQDQIPAQFIDSSTKSGTALDAAQSSESRRTNGNQSSADQPSTDNPSDSVAGNQQSANGQGNAETQEPTAVVSEKAKQTYFKIGSLLKNLPYDTAFFLHSLGRCVLSGKRLPGDEYGRTKLMLVANSIASSLVSLVKEPLPDTFSIKMADYTRRNIVMTTIAAMVDKRSDPTSQFLTIVIWFFKRAGGVSALLKIAEAFFANSSLPGYGGSDVKVHEATWAFQGLRTLFGFFMRATNQRSVHEATQTAALNVRADRERWVADYFSEAQFLVEMRYYALRFVQPIWESDTISKFSRDLVKHVCTILQYSLEASGESGALRRRDKLPPKPSTSKAWKPRGDDFVRSQVSRGVEEDLAWEALYRCNGHSAAAHEYCGLRERNSRLPRAPIPPEDQVGRSRINGDTESGLQSQLETRMMDSSLDADNDDAAHREAQELVSRLLETSDGPSSLESQDEDHTNAAQASGSASTNANETSTNGKPPGPQLAAEDYDFVTLETLDQLRSQMRDRLVDRCLHVLNSFDTLSFELADLITASVSKTADSNNIKSEIARTLLHSLISYQGGDDLKAVTGKIASSAHLLGVVFQDKTFFDSAREDLMDNVDSLTQYLALSKDTESLGNLTWMSNILLIVEKMLCEDLQPTMLDWTVNEAHQGPPTGQIVAYKNPLVAKDSRQEIFTAVADLLPKIGKDAVLATSCLRVLVALTRDPSVASQLSERKSMQRLFVMVKQLATVKDAKIMPLVLVILRQMIEDDSTVRQIMRSEIEAYFVKNARQSPTLNNYTRQLFHLSLRAPEIFAETTNDLLALTRVQGGAHMADQSLVMKRDLPPMEQVEESIPATNSEAAPATGASEDAADQHDAQQSTETTSGDNQTIDNKAPYLPRLDGVTSFLLAELLAYKDVQDRDQNTPSNGVKKDSQGDVEMTDGQSQAAKTQGSDARKPENARNDEKASFKLEDHPIFMYRCMLMQCLSELLQSYSLTKINFLAFSRKAEPLSTGTIKPRSGLLNYVLHELIADAPSGEGSDPNTRKRGATCNWATNVLTALCARTQEMFAPTHANSPEVEDDQDLTFIRRYVLEHALKAYKDASASTELSIEAKYSRLHNLSELFNRILTGRLMSNPLGQEHTREHRADTSKAIAKIMFEKHFIPMLTTSVSDLDAHTPDGSKALKSILKVLKTLTHTAINLSESGKITAPSEQDDSDEIASASSTSEVAEGREETPDLFRNSTLGMFEPGREEEPSSEDSEGEEDDEEDMYGDDYADDMEFDEEDPEHADGDVVSEEDEDAPEGMGDVEGMPGDVPMEVEIDMENDHEDHDTDEDDEDSESSEDDDDDDVEIMEDVEGDEEGLSAEEDDDEEDAEDWQDEDEDPIDFTNGPPGLSAGLPPMPGSGADSPSEQDLHMPGAGPDVDVLDDGDIEAFEERYDGDDIHEDPEDQDSEDEDREAEEEDDEFDEDELGFGGHDIDDEEMEIPPMPFHMGPAGARRHFHHPHHHHHHRHFHSFLPDMDSMFMPELRSHRPGGPRTPDDTQGVNPLLSRNRRDQNQPGANIPRPHRVGALDPFNPASLFASLGRNLPRDAFGFDRQALDQIIQTLGQGGAFSISMHGTDSHGHPVHGLRQVFEGGPPRPGQSTTERDDPYLSVIFDPITTKQRWEEVARILFGPDFVGKSNNLINSLLKVLAPPAIEREKKLKAKREEQERKFQEEQEKLRLEREEQEAREKKEREEREAEEAAKREAEEAEAARLAAENAAEQEEEEAEPAAEAMEGVEQSAATEAEQPAPPSEPAERVMYTVRGREVNIAHLGVDTAYLDALPEELREEVITQQAAEQRSTQPAASRGEEQPIGIDSEFLDALPSDIREEILQQEAQDRRRREREETRRRARESGAPAQADDMDPASFVASLDPLLRQQVLAESDEDTLAALPPDLQAEARALLGGHRRRAGVPPNLLGHTAAGLPFGRGGPARDLSTHARNEGEKRQRPPIVQMLDKAGIAGLLRLLFVPLHPQPRSTLNGVLLNVCGNRQTRSEVINGLLSILQDGCTDVSSVERCFSQLTLKARQQPVTKSPQKRSSEPPARGDISPNVVMDQSLTALGFLASAIAHIPHFFVTEHDTVGTAKGKTNRKGKGKEIKANRYPFMVLVGLLERDVVINNASHLDLLSGLLAQITQPLNNIGKKDANEKKDDKAPEGAEEAGSNGQQEAVQNPLVNQGSAEASNETSRPDTSQRMTDAPSAANDHTSAIGRGVEHSAQASNQQSSAAAGSSKPKEDSKTAKKTRNLSAPDVFAELLKPVVNLIMSRECNSKVFQNAIATMSSLAVIEGARNVFKAELIEQARSLAQTIQARLSTLTGPLKNAQNEIDAQSLALAELSPTGSDQTKFHRILTALDYLFQSETKSKEAQRKNEDDGKSKHEKAELMSLYEESSFMSIWNRLSEVLNAIKREDTFFFNVATILLSLIESLMLVCKRVTLSDGALSRRSTGATADLKDMPSVFFSFTNQHRKILNDLVRHNPKLMSNNFSVLIKNPGVLEFDNKRNFFSRRLHHRTGDMRHYPHPSLQLHVRREQVFLDSYKHLHYKSAQEIKYGKFNIRFHNEEGVDAGGVTREWFQVLARQMFNPDYALFNPVASDRTTFHPNLFSEVNPEHLSFFKFIGRIIGKALYENRVLDCHFSRAVYKKILGQPVSIKDMETVDLDYSKNMQWMLSNDITDIITETFSLAVDRFGVDEIVDLVPNGRNIPVTEENKEEYVRKVIEYRLVGSVSVQLDSFLEGFHDIVPTELISIFDDGELELLISGMPDVDVDDWRANTDYHNYNASSPQIQWFWRAVRSFDKEERARLLQFVTGTGKVPLNGFKELEGMNGFTRFSIHKDYGSHDRLPSSHTCFNQLDLPEYDSYEQLRKGLYTAMTTGNEHFGFA